MLSLLRRKPNASDELAKKWAFQLPLLFSGDTRFGCILLHGSDLLTGIYPILQTHDVATYQALALRLTNIIDTSIGAGIKLICTEFETERDYNMLNSRLRGLKQSIARICDDLPLYFQNKFKFIDCGEIVHTQFERGKYTARLRQIVYVCQIELVPAIQKRICNEFQQHRDIVATSADLQEFATRFDSNLGLAGAQECALRLLPQLEKTYQAMSDSKNILYPMKTDRDIQKSISLWDKKATAMQYCRALASKNAGRNFT